MKLVLFLLTLFLLFNTAYANHHYLGGGTGSPSPNPGGGNLPIAICSCAANASLQGSTVTAYSYPNAKKNVIVTNGVELPKINMSMITSSHHRYDIDIKKKSILIKFNSFASTPMADYGVGASFTFDNINPKPALGSNCTFKIIDINVHTNNSTEVNWLNTHSTFSDHSVKIVYGSDTNQANTPYARWTNNQWIKIDLVFGCKEKQGMTWGFAGYSDIKNDGVNSSCTQGKARLACETYPVNAPESNYCNITFPADHQTPNVDNGTRKCNPVSGDTVCSAERYVLCVAEENNKYYNHLPPYGNDQLAYPDYFNGSSPPYWRPRYKIHTLPMGNIPKAFYQGWVDQPVKLSRHKIKGKNLTPATGNTACGVGWRMASFNDGKWIPGMNIGLPKTYWQGWFPKSKQLGGWAFHAPLAADANIGWGHPGDSGSNARKLFVNERYWVKSTLGGNCW